MHAPLHSPESKGLADSTVCGNARGWILALTTKKRAPTGGKLPSLRLSQRVRRAAFWMTVLRLAVQALSMGRILVLARLLAPEDFGVVAIALVSLNLVEALSTSGFREALVQRKEEIREYLDTAWTVQIIKSAILGGCFFLAAPGIATLFDAPQVLYVVQVTSIVVFLNGLRNIGTVYLRRELQGSREFVYRIGQPLADTAVAVPLAFVFHNVWALVFGALAGGLMQLVLSYGLHPYRPRLRLDLPKARELFLFGRWILVNSTIGLLSSQGDRLVVGKLLGPAALGLYLMGGRLSGLLATEVTEVIARVSFPAFSKLQDSPLALRRGLLQVVGLGVSITLPFAVAVALLAPGLVQVVLGEQWIPAVPVIGILGFAAMVRMLVVVGGVPFQSIGRPAVVTAANTISLVAIIALLWPLIHEFGLLGAAVAVLLGNCLALPYLALKWFQDLGLRVESLVKATAPGLVLGGLVLLALLGGGVVFPEQGLASLVSSVALGGCTYLIGCAVLWQVTRTGPIQLLHGQRRSANASSVD